MATPRQIRRRGRFALVTVVLVGALAMTGIALGYVSTDQPDYTPGSVVTIQGDNSNGAGYVPGSTVNVAATADNGLWADTCSATVAEDGTWSCQVTLSSDESVAVGGYSYTATSTAADGSPISESGTFTDGSPQPVYDATLTTPTLVANSPVSVQYSDKLHFAGTITCTQATGLGLSPVPIGCVDQTGIHILVQLKIGTTWTDVADSGAITATFPTTGGTYNWSFDWQAGRDDSLATVDPGTYSARVRISSLGGSPWYSDGSNGNGAGVANSVQVTKEGTTTAYGAPISGDPNDVINLSATVADQDGGIGTWATGEPNGVFSPDANLAGTNVVHFALYSGTCPLSGTPSGSPVAGPVNANIDQNGATTGTPQMTLPAAAGSYCMLTSYDGNTYYKSSYKTIAITVTAGYVSEGFYAPVDSVNLMKAGQTIPLKWNLWLGTETPATEIIDPTIGAGHYSLTSTITSCSLAGTNDDPPLAGDAGSSGLRYSYFATPTDTANGQDIFAWQTNKTWANTCRTFTVTYNGYTVATALFQFTK